MSEKHKSSAIPVKNKWKTIGIEEKLDVICQIEEGEWIVDICCSVRFAHSTVSTICDNADRITKRAKSGTKVFV
jgi:hypothetical protein